MLPCNASGKTSANIIKKIVKMTAGGRPHISKYISTQVSAYVAIQ